LSGEQPQFVDYYDILQVSQNADVDTIRRIFRHLAKKCHPDLNKGGDADQFRQLLKAHEVLTNDEARAAYDIRYSEFWDQKWNLVKQSNEDENWTDKTDVRERILSLFYVQRRTNTRHPGLGEMELSQLLHIPIEFIEFDLWYLREKNFLQRLESGLLAITVGGVDHIEEGKLHLSEDRLLEAQNP
jgi:curved DNA-binding protein CbpA